MEARSTAQCDKLPQTGRIRVGFMIRKFATEKLLDRPADCNLIGL